MLYFSNLPAQAKYDGGSGTAEDPYQIATAADLILLGDSPEDYSKHFILTADIDLNPNLPGSKVFNKAVIAFDTDLDKSGFQGDSFTGVFDGNDCKIIALTIDVGDAPNIYLGLFGYNDGEVRKLGLEGGSVSGGEHVGSLIGFNSGTVSNCYSTADVNGIWDYVGGLVGENEEGIILNCYSTGVVNGTWDRVGGLVGFNERGSLWKCYSTGDVSGYCDVGGLVGLNSGTASNCYSTSDVNRASVNVGGLVGLNWGSVSDCYSTGNVIGYSWDIGGLIGDNVGSVSDCYSTGDVRGYYLKVGGLVGNNDGSALNCFWDTDTQTHGVDVSVGDNNGKVTNVAGLPTAQMQTKSTFTSTGWDFIDESTNGTSETWQMPTGGGYPILSLFHNSIPVPLPGSGTISDPFLIGTAKELGMVNWYPKNCCFKLTSDIDLSAISWSVSVVPIFNGYFAGDGHKLTNMKISSGSCLGFFGYLEKDSRVTNLGLEACSLSGYDRVGVLAGRNRGRVLNCYSTGNVSGHDRVGGLVGCNYVGTVSHCYSTCDVTGGRYVGGIVGECLGTISECYATGSVSGLHNVGGLAGQNGNLSILYYVPGNIANCYSTGSVTGETQVGGLLGQNNRIVTNCYCIGDVSGGGDVGGILGYNDGAVLHGSISNCFWDINTQSHGVTVSIGDESYFAKSINVVGLPTAQMQTENTFTSAGWDFVGESANGTEDIWTLEEGDYPRLAWQSGFIQPPSKPINPSPSNGASDRSIETNISWSDGGGADSFDVYFGTNPTPDSGEFKQNQTESMYEPDTLAYSTTYYWRINAQNPYGMTVGHIWSFTTESTPIPHDCDFCGPNFGPPDGYVDVWDLMYFSDCWHCKLGDPCWDDPDRKGSKCDLSGPDFGEPDGSVDVWDLMVFADHWHEGVKT